MCNSCCSQSKAAAGWQFVGGLMYRPGAAGKDHRYVGFQVEQTMGEWRMEVVESEHIEDRVGLVANVVWIDDVGKKPNGSSRLSSQILHLITGGLPNEAVNGSPSSSWAVFKARLSALFADTDVRVCTAFWIFGDSSFHNLVIGTSADPTLGLINNVVYVIILSAALDLVGPNVSKAVVLLADIIPSFLIKLCAPYFIHIVPYSLRIILFAVISSWGMLLIALAPPYTDRGTITTKLAGIVLASLSSGAGELSFLGLTHYYGSFSQAAWGSGTGAAGLIGAGAYAIATTSIGLSVKTTLLASSFLPLVMLLSFSLLLPRGPLRRNDTQRGPEGHSEHDGNDDASLEREDQGLLSDPSNRPATIIYHSSHDADPNVSTCSILPLMLVYFAEYLINQSVAPTLLFPLDETPFTEYRSFYPTYATIYQLGVFISRSSLPFLRFPYLYPPSLLQCLNLLLLILASLYNTSLSSLHPIHPIYIIFILIFWEGLLGGLVYVNTYVLVAEKVDEGEREFALGAVSVSDSAGIMLAGFVGVLGGVEEGLCAVQRGRGWEGCGKT
ncbi:MAG: hypothetical protein Q9166_000267 [cf. Caloplaca sp. 2 TL-2023]